MLAIEEIINLFGQSPDDQALELQLTKLNINERPKFDGNPSEWVGKEKDGYLLMFRAKHGYEDSYGATNAIGNMILNGVRLFSADNKDGYSEYKGKLPFCIYLNKKPDELKEILGQPDFEDETGTPKRTFIWNNIQNVEIGVVFNRDETQIAWITIGAVKMHNRNIEKNN